MGKARGKTRSEKEGEEALWSGWHLGFASESVDLKGQEENHLGGTKQLLATGAPSLLINPPTETPLLTANVIQRLQSSKTSSSP